MEFLAQNYLWFLIGGIIILMAVIGYIAERTNFGRGNGPKKKQVKQVKNIEEPALDQSGIISDIPEVTENAVVDNDGLEDITLPEVELQPLESFESEINPDLSEDLAAPFGEEKSELENIQEIDEDLTAPLTDSVEETEEDLTAPLSEEKTELENVQEIDEDLTAPFGDDNKEVEEVTLEQPLEVVELEKDAVGTIENNEEIEEDEVWKF